MSSTKDRAKVSRGLSRSASWIWTSSLRRARESTWRDRCTRGRQRDCGRSRAPARIRQCLARPGWCRCGRRPDTRCPERLFGRDRQRLDRERFGRRQASGAVIAHVRPGERAVPCERRRRSHRRYSGSSARARSNKPARLREAIRGKPPVVRAHSLKIEVHRVRARGPLGAPRLGDDELRVKGVGEAGDDLVLHVEQVGDRLVEPLRPEMIAALGVDELDVHPDAVGRALDAAFEHVAHVEFAPDLFEIDGLALVAESGVSPDHPHPAHLREVGRQALGDAVDEIVLLRIAPDIGEGKNHDRKARRPWLCGFGSELRAARAVPNRS